MKKVIDNIILIGTSHVSEESVKEIEESINEYKPEIVCIELDRDRLEGLMSENKEEPSNFEMAKELGFGGFVFAKTGKYIQNKIGKSLNIEAGSDMKNAFLIAKKNNLMIELIDLNINITLRKISKISFFKKIGIFFKLITKSFDKKYRNEIQEIGLGKAPDEKLITFAINFFEKELPEMYKILIDDRNKYMAKRILELNSNTMGNILVVVGAGHVPGIEKILKKKLKDKKLKDNKSENVLNLTFSLEND